MCISIPFGIDMLDGSHGCGVVGATAKQPMFRMYIPMGMVVKFYPLGYRHTGWQPWLWSGRVDGKSGLCFECTYPWAWLCTSIPLGIEMLDGSYGYGVVGWATMCVISRWAYV